MSLKGPGSGNHPAWFPQLRPLGAKQKQQQRQKQSKAKQSNAKQSNAGNAKQSEAKQSKASKASKAEHRGGNRGCAALGEPPGTGVAHAGEPRVRNRGNRRGWAALPGPLKPIE